MKKKETKGHNRVWIAGHVGGKIVSGVTRDGDSAYSFGLSSISNGHHKIWVRVNAYGSIADECLRDIERGSYCSVVGELMNRSGKFGELTEVRVREIVVHPNHEK